MENHLQNLTQAQTWPAAPLGTVDAHRLVGSFMHRWAMLEGALDVAIRRILKFDSVAMAILSVNLPFAAKLYTARCAVSMFGVREPKAQKAAQKVLIDIGKMSEHRNMLAHTAFDVSKDKTGVEFYRITARSKLDIPDVIWTPNDFSTKVIAITSLMSELSDVMEKTVELRSAVDLRKKDTQGVIAALLAAGQTSMAKENADPVGGLLGLRSLAPAKAEDGKK